MDGAGKGVGPVDPGGEGAEIKAVVRLCRDALGLAERLVAAKEDER